jgi:hypothetical protein
MKRQQAAFLHNDSAKTVLEAGFDELGPRWRPADLSATLRNGKS